MSLENVKLFYTKLAVDEAFRVQIQDAKSKNECSQIVKSFGYDFTQEEFEEYTAQLLESSTDEDELRDLSEHELATVVGGATLALWGSLFPHSILIYGAPVGLWESNFLD